MVVGGSSEPPYAKRLRELVQLDRWARERYGLSDDHPVIRHIARLIKEWDPMLAMQVTRALEYLCAERAKMKFVGDRVPPTGILDGDVYVGYAPTPHGEATRVHLLLGGRPLTWLLAGVPGHGKTVTAQTIVRTVTNEHPDLALIVFDPNRSHERFCSDPRLWLNLRWEDLRINPLRPPSNYAFSRWFLEKVDSLTRNTLVFAKFLLAERLDYLAAKAGLPTVDDGRCTIPTLYDLRDDLIARPCKPGSKQEQYRQSLLTVIQGKISMTGGTYDCVRAYEDTITRSRVRISTEGLGPEAVEDLVTNVVHYAYRRHSVEPIREPSRTRLLVVWEEAGTALARRESIPFFQELFARSRSVEIGYMLIVQDVSLIDRSITSLIGHYFMFAQSNAPDKRITQEILDLSPSEAALLGSLEKGSCFVKFVGHEWPFPFYMRVER